VSNPVLFCAEGWLTTSRPESRSYQASPIPVADQSPFGTAIHVDELERILGCGIPERHLAHKRMFQVGVRSPLQGAKLAFHKGEVPQADVPRLLGIPTTNVA
jgi:hypothetical protein